MRKWLLVMLIIAGLSSSPYIALSAKVVVDPGHGGRDPGAVGINGLYEKTVNTAIAEFLREMLLQNGYEVLMTRRDDRFVSLEERVEFARNSGADLFVSIHANSHASSSIRGTMVLYYDAAYPNPRYPASKEMIALSPESKKLAQYVLQAVLEQVPNVNRGIVPSSAYVVRMGNIPSILVETAFLSNPQDAWLLSSPEMQKKYAQGILNGIMRYLPAVFSDIGSHWAKDSILRLHELGIASGYGRTFGPDRPLTRAELTAFAERAFGFPAAKSAERVIVAESAGDKTVTENVYGAPAPQPPLQMPGFHDLAPDHWAYDTLLQAAASGVLRGYPDGTIRPDAPVTRAEAAAVLERLIGNRLVFSPAGEIVFSDVDESYWAYWPIMQLSRAGIVRGIENGQFGPDRHITRAEIAVMVDRQLSGGGTYIAQAA